MGFVLATPAVVSNAAGVDLAPRSHTLQADISDITFVRIRISCVIARHAARVKVSSHLEWHHSFSAQMLFINEMRIF